MMGHKSTFRWQALSPRGEARRGSVRAESREAALQQLYAGGLLSVVIDEVAPGGSRWRRQRLRGDEIAVMMSQIAALLTAGLPLLQSLQLLERQQSKPSAARVLAAIRARIESGAAFSEAAAAHPAVFSQLATAMISAGETSGQLGEAFLQLAATLERASRIRQQLTKALFYPATILVIGLGAAVVLLVFVVPAFAQTFASFHAELPLPTRVVIAMSDALVSHAAAGVGLVSVAAALLRWRFRGERGLLDLDRLRLQMPLLGTLYSYAAVARTAGTLAMLLRAGVPVIEAFDTAARAAANRALERGLLDAREAVRQGQTLAHAIGAIPLLPRLLSEMIAVGEQTGALDQMLARTGAYFEAELQRRIDSFTSMLEPAAVVFLGVTLGGLVIAMYLPVFRLGTLLG